MEVSRESRLFSGAREVGPRAILLLDADPRVRQGVSQLVDPSIVKITAVASPDQAMLELSQTRYAVVLIDLDTPTTGAGLALIPSVRERAPAARIYLLSGKKSFDTAVEAFRAGAADVILKSTDQVDYLREKLLSVSVDGSQLVTEMRGLMEELMRRFAEAERRVVELERNNGSEEVPSDDIGLLVIDPDDTLYRELTHAHTPLGFRFEHAGSGGDGIDHATRAKFVIVLCAAALPDLPQSMVIRALRAQVPEVIIISYQFGGVLQIVESSRNIPLCDPFHHTRQILPRLGELVEAQRTKSRERQTMQVIREKHQDFLRRFADLKRRMDGRA